MPLRLRDTRRAASSGMLMAWTTASRLEEGVMRCLSRAWAIAALALMMAVPLAQACTCVETDFFSAYTRSDAIFLGEVVEVASAEPDYPMQAWVTVRVENAWKG